MGTTSSLNVTSTCSDNLYGISRRKPSRRAPNLKLPSARKMKIRLWSSSNFFIRSLQMSDAFYKSSFFLNYSTLFYDGEQMQQLLVNCFGVRVSSVLLLCSKKNKNCVGNVYTRSIQKLKKRLKAFWSSQCLSCANIDSVMRYCMTKNFLCSCGWQYSYGDDKFNFSSPCWSCAWTSAENFPEGGQSRHLAYPFQFVGVATQMDVHKNVQCYGSSYIQCFPYKKILHWENFVLVRMDIIRLS